MKLYLAYIPHLFLGPGAVQKNEVASPAAVVGHMMAPQPKEWVQANVQSSGAVLLHHQHKGKPGIIS